MRAQRYLPDNNASERETKMIKIKLKSPGILRPDQGSDAFLDLLSIIETSKKHNNSSYTDIRALFKHEKGPYT